MSTDEELRRAATTEGAADYLRRANPRPQQLHQHGGGMESIRRMTYRGHDIVVRTTYDIQVDGSPLGGHLEVTNTGLVHHHAVPNYVFPSAVDLVRQLIDAFPDDFDAGSDGAHGAHGAHDSPRPEEA